jgi:hypothetical protein
MVIRTLTDMEVFMKKLYALSIAAVLAGFLFTACEITFTGDIKGTGTIGLSGPAPEVMYLKLGTDLRWPIPSEPDPEASYFVFQSDKAWKDYLAPLKELPEGYAWDDKGPVEFLLDSAEKAYNKTIFSSYNLVMILLTESSGSITPKVATKTVENGELKITLKRIVPETGTTDMAYWRIFIPVKKSDFNGNIVNITIEDVIE